jgi:hypothetical protein
MLLTQARYKWLRKAKFDNLLIVRWTLLKREREREKERERKRQREKEREREREWNFKVIAFFQTDGQQQTRQSRKNVVNKLLLWVDVAGGSGKNIGAIRECQVVDFVRRRATDKFGSRRSVGLPKIHSF